MTDTTNPTPEQFEDRAMATKIQLVARHLSSLLAEAHEKGLRVRIQVVDPASAGGATGSVAGDQVKNLPQRIELVSVARMIAPLTAPSAEMASTGAQRRGAVD